MFGLIFIDSFFVCVTCFPCCKMSMFFPHVPKVRLPVYATLHKIITNCFKTDILFGILMSLVKMRTKHVFFYVLYTCAQRWYPTQTFQSSCSAVSDSLRPRELQHTRLPCPSPAPGACSNSCSLSWWCYPTSHPLSSPSPPAFNLFQHQGLFKWVSSSHQGAKVLEFQLQYQSFQWPFRTDFL